MWFGRTKAFLLKHVQDVDLPKVVEVFLDRSLPFIWA
jgi:hypothetical protein